MRNKGRLASIFTAGLALAGCQTNENMVRFGDYAMSADTFDHMMRIGHGTIDYEALEHLGFRSDKNRDGYITREELDQHVKDATISGAR